MSTPFMGQIEIFSFNFAPKGWALCNGQLLPINQNQALFSLLGTQFGGNGQTTFGLPDMRSRIPISMGTNVIGTAAGQEVAYAHPERDARPQSRGECRREHGCHQQRRDAR